MEHTCCIGLQASCCRLSHHTRQQQHALACKQLRQQRVCCCSCSKGRWTTVLTSLQVPACSSRGMQMQVPAAGPAPHVVVSNSQVSSSRRSGCSRPPNSSSWLPGSAHMAAKLRADGCGTSSAISTGVHSHVSCIACMQTHGSQQQAQ